MAGKSKEEFEQAEALTAKKEDFAEWYQQVLSAAKLLDKRYNVKGCYVWLNYGYELMLNLRSKWDYIFKKNKYKEMYFPLLVPVEYAEQNDQWWNGFRTQAFWVKGLDEEKANYILRPTGEPAMYPMFKLWIRSWKDLPLKIYETVSSFRYETGHTRPIIRDREITVWYEIHTAHTTKEESEQEIIKHMEMVDQLWKECAVVPLKVNKPQWECFPGAVGAVEYYNIMPNGRAMENGSFNNLGQAYAKKFDVKFRDKDEQEKYAWMTCTGNGARLLAAVIGMHGDDSGLVIPPHIAPIQAIVIPIFNKDNQTDVLNAANKLCEKLENDGFKVDIDARDDVRPGSKFYDAELKGIPVRIEIGPKDILEKSVVAVRRDTKAKKKIAEADLSKELKALLEEIQESMYKKAQQWYDSVIVDAHSKDEIKKAVENKKVAKVLWCREGACWDEIKVLTEGIEMFGTAVEDAKHDGKCAVCGKPTKTYGYVAHTY
jgi:prolyl-tRNA synthetase